MYSIQLFKALRIRSAVLHLLHTYTTIADIQNIRDDNISMLYGTAAEILEIYIEEAYRQAHTKVQAKLFVCYNLRRHVLSIATVCMRSTMRCFCCACARDCNVC